MTQTDSGAVKDLRTARPSPACLTVLLARFSGRPGFGLISSVFFFILTNLGRSDSLDTWNQVYQSPSGVALSDVVWGNGQFVAVGSVGTNLISETSSDGTNWVMHQAGPSASRLAYGNGLFLALDYAG